MKRIIADLRDRGKAVILSTHQMNQIEELCDRVLMIHHGREVFSGTLREIKARFRRSTIQVAVEGQLDALPGVAKMRPVNGFLELTPAQDTTPQMILDQLREREVVLNHFSISTPSLNEIFLQIVREGHE